MLQQPNYTQVPNDFLDTYMAKLHPSATAVFLAICRKTIGWHKETDSISISQLCGLTGLVDQTVRDAVKELMYYELIAVDRVTGASSTFTVNMDPSQKTGGGSSQISGGDPSQKTIPTKETLQKKEKETPQSPSGLAPSRKPVNGARIDFSFESFLFKGISDEQVEAWSLAYPALDVDTELAKAASWLKVNPAKRKKNYGRFLVNWLSRAQERGGDRVVRKH